MSIFNNIFKDIDNNINVVGLNDELNAIYIYSYFKKNNEDVIVVTNTLFEANKLYDSLRTYTDEVYFFPADDFLTSEAIAISPDLKLIRLDTINHLIDKGHKIVVTHLMGYLRYLPTKQLWQDSIIHLKVNDEYDIKELFKKLFNIGYTREIIVGKTGEMALRGYVLDIFPINEKKAIRLEFFGDTIESIRYFDVDTQRSLGDLNKISIYPYDEFIVPDNINEDVLRKQKNLPLILKDIASIKDYLTNPTIVYKDYNQLKNAYLILREEIYNYHIEKDVNTKTNYMHDFYDIYSPKNIYLMTIDNVIDKNIKVRKYDSKEIDKFDGNIIKIKNYINNMIKLNKTVIIALTNDLHINNFIKHLDENYVITNENKIIDKRINIIKRDINHGFIIGDLVVITEYELFKARTEVIKKQSNFKYSTKIKDIAKIKIGDYVVHNTHGIGIYMGVTTLTVNGLKKDYLLIKYSGNDKLYIPVEKIDLISKFSGSESYTPKINHLGGTEWQKTKLRIKGKIKDIADKLLKLAAIREATIGYKFNKDTEEQLIFEKGFIYEETEDQIRATEEIKKDMEKDRPMDRLLCGDVGYGKTEVAFRAMFKAVLNAKQVAYLCPTTILSKQQYESALERFSDFPINIELLNRFTPLKKEKQIIEDLKNGRVDILFGTHKILNEKVKFKDLGLLIVDEEQRFGVLQKEKIKEYKANVDVLTLSATPIPRTLQMSMIGLRDLSLIETPPINRYPIQTYVLPFNLEIIKQAVYRELSRHGQVFILYNKVDNMLDKVEEISKLVPDASVTYAHGQMKKTELERRMLSFINKEYDILVCSTIIETGIDIPNVNTLIIIDADKFGLSQLYQIRGRVGRSDRIAYAYLMYDDRKVLNDNAVKRLNVIKEFTELGSGFAIAARDLSIRGAGDILGSEQAGFIDAIGIELYIKMLNEEVARLKGEKIPIEEEVSIDEKPLINVETHIDDKYVSEEEIKIEIHKKINNIDSLVKLKAIKEELEDRFGKISDSIEIYMYQEWFEKLAKKLNIIKVVQTNKDIEITFAPIISSRIDGEKLFMAAYNISNMFQFKYKKDRLSIKLNINKLKKHYIYYVTELLQSMIKMISNKNININ